jgi:hypothetical protein
MSQSRHKINVLVDLLLKDVLVRDRTSVPSCFGANAFFDEDE